MAIHYRPADLDSPADLAQAVHPDASEPVQVVPSAAEVRARIDALNDRIRAIQRLDAQHLASDHPAMRAAHEALHAANAWFVAHRILTMWDAARGRYTVAVAN